MPLYKIIINAIKKVAKYARNFGISAILDVSVFAIVVFFMKPIFGTGFAIVFASVVARILSSLLNFSLNKALFLNKNASNKGCLVRYYTLWLTLLTLTSTITYLINDVFSVNEVVAKMISDMSLGIFSFQVQMRWVFKEKSNPLKKGLYFRIVRRVFRLFLKRKVIIDENIFMKENILIAHHQNFYGPVSCMVWLPDTVNVWGASHLYNFKECFNIYYHFTFRKTIKLPKIIAFIMATFSTFALVPLLKSSKSIPVYRESKKIMKTFNDSMEILNKGQQILIFPDIKYNDNSQIMGEILTGFIRLEKLYYRSKNEHIGFVPIIINKTIGTITNDNTIYFSDDNSYEVEKEIVLNKIIDSINLKYLNDIASTTITAKV